MTPALTPREQDVLQLVAQGHTHAEIGERLGVTERVAKYTTLHLRAKFGVRQKHELVRVAQDWLRTPERA
jgi:DNA-binding CsgD family transcriptional regulator